MGRRRIGTEHEKLAVMAGTTQRAAYPAIQYILEGLRDRFGWNAIEEAGERPGACAIPAAAPAAASTEACHCTAPALTPGPVALQGARRVHGGQFQALLQRHPLDVACRCGMFVRCSCFARRPDLSLPTPEVCVFGFLQCIQTAVKFCAVAAAGAAILSIQQGPRKQHAPRCRESCTSNCYRSARCRQGRFFPRLTVYDGGRPPLPLAGQIIGCELDGQSVTLEPGGQFELSGAPVSTLPQTCQEVGSHLFQVRTLHPLSSTHMYDRICHPGWISVAATVAVDKAVALLRQQHSLLPPLLACKQELL